jgi:hypothetical protein
MRRCDFRPPLPPRFVTFAWRYPTVRLCSLPRSPTPAARPGAFGFGSPTPTAVDSETAGALRFLGNPPVPVPCSRTPAGPRTPGHDGVSAWPPLWQKRRLPRFANFGAQSHGFSTRCLRFVRWVAHTRTQDSLLVAGQALPGGIRTRRIPTNSAMLNTSLPLLPSFSWRNPRPLFRSC